MFNVYGECVYVFYISSHLAKIDRRDSVYSIFFIYSSLLLMYMTVNVGQDESVGERSVAFVW